MANSFSFNTVDMSDYGLRIRKHEEPFGQDTPAMQLLDRAYGYNSLRPALEISLDVVIQAADLTTLLSYLDSIKSALNVREDAELTIDSYTDRYWLARFVSMAGGIVTAKNWEGTITFVCHEPAAFDNEETESGPHTINEDPEEIEEVVDGTEQTYPVYALTCDDTLTDTTVEIANVTTGETISWEGDLVADDELEIDCQNFVVKLNGTENMLTVTGSFPKLLPGSNELSVYGFSGTLTITYRARYI